MLGEEKPFGQVKLMVRQADTSHCLLEILAAMWETHLNRKPTHGGQTQKIPA